MNCPDCKKPTRMDLDFLDQTKARDMFEIVFKCPRCKTTFFGTLYRDEKQSIGDADCNECEQEENN